MDKVNVNDLAIFGGNILFPNYVSTSSLSQPAIANFLDYSKRFFMKRQYTNSGPLVKLLEKRLAEFHGADFCVSFCSGFWALAITIKAVSLKGKSEVIIPSLTYRRMADIAAWVNLKPRFCEVDPDTLAISAETASVNVNAETALILAVHPIINCCDIGGLINLSKMTGIPLIFDSVESVMETCDFGKIGKFGDAECFSMHASKLINGFEGGYVTTNNPAIAHQISLLRGFGFSDHDYVEIPGGMNAKLNEIHAAMALANLDEIDSLVERNRNRYQCYKMGLKSLDGVRLIEFDEAHKSGYKNIIVELTEAWPISRAETLAILNAERILARSYYSPPLHKKNMDYPHVPAHLTLTDDLSARFMSLPCGEFVTQDDIYKIINLLNFIYSHSQIIKSRLV